MRNRGKQELIKYLESEAIKSEGEWSEMKRKTNRERKRAD